MKTHQIIVLTAIALIPSHLPAQDLDRVEEGVVERSVRENASTDEERMHILLETLGASRVPEGWLVSLPEETLFDFGKASLRTAATDTLDDVSDLYFLTGEPRLIIEGHADPVGSEDYNMELSNHRASVVADWLISEGGVNASQVTTAALGEQRPQAPNTEPDGTDNPEGRQLNRRVEILFLHDHDLLVPAPTVAPAVR